MLETGELVKKIIDDCPTVAPYARVVGRWVWVEFPSKPAPEAIAFLKSAGFRWNRVRKVWQHSCGWYARQAPYDPRMKYRVSGPLSELAETPAAVA